MANVVPVEILKKSKGKMEMETLLKQEDGTLRDLFSQCSNGQTTVSFSNTYARLLVFSLPRLLSKKLVRDAFEASNKTGGTTGRLEFHEWCAALGKIAMHVFPMCESEVAAMRSLVRMVRFGTLMCLDVSEFVHALNCIDSLNISFCYWDAFRLHRQYAARGFRGLLHALKASTAMDSFQGHDINEFGQRLLYVDKRKKRKYDKELLATLDKLSSVLIELYPDLGLGSNFVDFVDKLVDDKLIPVLCATHLDRPKNTDNQGETEGQEQQQENDMPYLEFGNDNHHHHQQQHHGNGPKTPRTPIQQVHAPIDARKKSSSSQKRMQRVESKKKNTISSQKKEQQPLDNAQVKGILRKHRGLIARLHAECSKCDSIREWLSNSSIYPTMITLDRADVAWQASEGNFEMFLCFMGWMSDSVLESGLEEPSQQLDLFLSCLEQFETLGPHPLPAPKTPPSPTRKKREKRQQQQQQQPKAPPPVLMRLFVSVCKDEKEYWTKDDWYGFVNQYTTPKLPWLEYCEILMGRAEIDFDTYWETMQELAQKNISVTMEMNEMEQTELIQIEPLKLDLLYTIFTKACEPLETSAFETMVDTWMESGRPKTRIETLYDWYGFESNNNPISMKDWVAFVTSFAFHCDESLQISAVSYLYQEFQPLKGLETVIELLHMLITTIQGSTPMKKISNMFMYMGPEENATRAWFPSNAFLLSSGTPSPVLDQLEKSLQPIETVDHIHELDIQLYRYYIGMHKNNEKRLHMPSLVESVLYMAHHVKQCKPSEFVLFLFSKPVYLSRSGAYEYLFRPAVVSRLESSKKAVQDMFTRFCDKDTGLLSLKSFLRCTATVNLAVGVPESQLHKNLVSLLRDTKTLEQIFYSTADHLQEEINQTQFIEAIGRLALALAFHMQDQETDKGEQEQAQEADGQQESLNRDILEGTTTILKIFEIVN